MRSSVSANSGASVSFRVPGVLFLARALRSLANERLIAVMASEGKINGEWHATFSFVAFSFGSNHFVSLPQFSNWVQMPSAPEMHRRQSGKLIFWKVFHFKVHSPLKCGCIAMAFNACKASAWNSFSFIVQWHLLMSFLVFRGDGK